MLTSSVRTTRRTAPQRGQRVNPCRRAAVPPCRRAAVPPCRRTLLGAPLHHMGKLTALAPVLLLARTMPR